MLPLELVATPATSPYDGRLRRSAFASKLMSRTDWARSDAPNANAPAAIVNDARRFIAASLPSTGCTRARGVQREFLNSPLRDFGDVHLVRIPAIHLMHGAEFLGTV